MKIQETVNNYYMDKKENDEQIHLFLGICLIALGVSILSNLIVEYLTK
jgi:uncharacterized membrane protein HdeD (DUF308 family)